MKTDKPLFFTSSSQLGIDSNGNKLLFKPAKIKGDSVILQFVIRSEQDIKKSRHQGYQLLVPQDWAYLQKLNSISMFETGYKFRLATRQVVRNEFPLIEKSIYTFSTKKNKRYVVDVHRYEYRVYVLKFHYKAHSNSRDRYNLILNDFDVSTIIRTILDIALGILADDALASFAFVGARKIDEVENAVRTQRFRVYKRVAEYFLGEQTFSHTYEERSNCYLLVNRSNDNTEAVSESIIDMFAKTFQGIEHL